MEDLKKTTILEKIDIYREYLCGECEFDDLRRSKNEIVCMQKLLDEAADEIRRLREELNG